MTEFDFAGWIARALAFTARIGQLPGAEVRSNTVLAPLAESEMQAVEHALGSVVPPPLRALITRGAAAVDCAYVLQPQGRRLDQLRTILPDETRIFGGARLTPASELAGDSDAVRAWARDTWVAEYPDERSMWESALPFIRLDNGDYVALDLRVEDKSDPPVAYLSHDDEGFVLAPNLAAFLTAWERLRYLGPEAWLLHPFTDDSGQLDGQDERAARLRVLLEP